MLYITQHLQLPLNLIKQQICSYYLDRPAEKIKVMREYLRAVKLMRNYNDTTEDPVYTQVIELDLGTVVTSVSGPKRPHDRVSVSEMKNDFISCLTNKVICLS